MNEKNFYNGICILIYLLLLPGMKTRFRKTYHRLVFGTICLQTVACSIYENGALSFIHLEDRAV
jgi:hypothetical protein